MLRFPWAVVSTLWATVLWVAILGFLPPSHPAGAHEGHDHERAVVSLPTTVLPRTAVTGDEFEAVAVLKGGELLIFVDRFEDNTPVTAASVTVTLGSQELKATPTSDGTYHVSWPAEFKSGRHDVVISIRDGSTNDLLITTLEISTTAAAAPPSSDRNALGAIERFQRWRTGTPTWAIGTLAICLAAAFIVFRRRGATREAKARADSQRRNRLAVVWLLAGFLINLPSLPLQAHEGHDHGSEAEKTPLVTGDFPRRLPDGSVFLPKPTQRLLDVRTSLVKEAPHQPSQTLVGRVIANPNRSGLVQSSTGGRITSPEGGLPRLGQSVKAGDVLATITPAFLAIDSANVAQTAGDLDQQIELARTKSDRAQRLYSANAGSRVQAEDAELTLKGLERRRAALNTSQARSESLVAPVDGVISSARAVPGQVVAPQDILFEIIDARSLWVEALVFDTSSSQKFEQSVAVTADGATFPLTFVGRSRSLRQQSAILQFEIASIPQSLDVGTAVSVLAHAGELITAIVLPKAAVVRSANGEDIVWRHTEPERFVPTPVKIAPFDGARVLVQAGLSSGQRIVVQSAELVSQVR